MKRRIRSCFLSSLILLLPVAAFGDKLELYDGKTVEGRVVSVSEAEIRLQVGVEVKSFPVASVVALTLGPLTGKGVSADLVNLDSSAYPIAVAQIKSDHKNRNECVKECSKAGPSDPKDSWFSACSNYCDCLWETDNSKENCEKAFTEDSGGRKPPFSLPPKDPCNQCVFFAPKVKTCVDKNALGPGEDLVVTVPCEQSTPTSWACKPCLFAFTLRKTCCRGGVCWTEPCDLSVAATPLK